MIDKGVESQQCTPSESFTMVMCAQHRLFVLLLSHVKQPQDYVLALLTIHLAACSQGRTSRWAIAWSFAADPQTADIPMPRYVTASGPVIGC